MEKIKEVKTEENYSKYQIPYNRYKLKYINNNDGYVEINLSLPNDLEILPYTV